MWTSAVATEHELILFALVGFIVGGIDDLAIDLIWIARYWWRQLVVYRRHARVDVATLAPARRPGRIAVFIPAWDEAAVIGDMLRHAVDRFGSSDYRIYVGAYPNDPATIAAAGTVASPRVRLIVGLEPGPTTKAACLNQLWRAMIADEAREGVAVKAVVLHDAEDIVHSAELRLFDALIERFDLVQLPVLPLIDPNSRWIAGHYADEFAEAHGKTIVVREALGAGLPSAGVGCAFSRATLGRIANARGGAPFDADSLTEDYELGLRIAARGGRAAFVRLPGAGRAATVAIRAHFPATLDAAVRQKARWIAGIALSGWDRLGWRGGLAERWMRIRDRRAPLAAMVLLAGYAAVVLGLALSLAAWLGGAAPPGASPLLGAMLSLSGALLLWRLLMRSMFVTRAYGWREGLIAIPRAVVGNIVAVMAARRALGVYRRMRGDGIVRWDKTTHHFPLAVPAE